MHISDLFSKKVSERGSCLLLGLDPHPNRIPSHVSGDGAKQAHDFCHSLVDACAEHVSGIKIQMACFEQYGAEGIGAAQDLIAQAASLDLLVVIDGKRGDIGSTASMYAQAYLDPQCPLAGDALTINPWLGADAMQPFIDAAGFHNRMLFVLAHTSNPDAAMFQLPAREPMIDFINRSNATDTGDNRLGRMGAVVGATNSQELEDWHKAIAQSWLLTPGIGAQQGDIQELRRLRAAGAQLLVPISRAILYADPGAGYAKAGAKVAATYRQQLELNSL